MPTTRLTRTKYSSFMACWCYENVLHWWLQAAATTDKDDHSKHHHSHALYTEDFHWLTIPPSLSTSWDIPDTIQHITIALQQQRHTIVLWPFVRNHPGEPVPEETLTHPPSWSSSNLYQLLPSTTFHTILPVQTACLAIFFAQPLSMSFLGYITTASLKTLLK